MKFYGVVESGPRFESWVSESIFRSRYFLEGSLKDSWCICDGVLKPLIVLVDLLVMLIEVTVLLL